MNKIIPVLSIITAIIGTTIAAVGLAALVISVQADSLGVAAVALPFVIIGTTITSISAVFAFFFKRDRLCFISFFINIGGVALSVVSLIIWFAAL